MKYVAFPHPAAIEDDALLRACVLGRGRSSGPGGQHRNKVETEVTLTHSPTGIAAVAGERRSAAENKRVALRRLRLKLAVECRAPVALGPIGSALWKSRVRGLRISCNPEHHDYPAMLAEALDVLEACGWDTTRAGLRLECTATQLVRLIKDHAPALERMNAERARFGLRALR